MLSRTIFIAICVLAGWIDAAGADGRADLDACSTAGRAGDYATALKYCTSAIESKDLAEKDRARALQYRGSAYTYLGRFEEAIADYNEGIRLDDGDADLFAGRGWTLQQKGELAQSIPDLDHALELDPGNFWALNNRGWGLGKLGRYDDAIRDSSRAIEIDPNAPGPYLNRANAYVDLHRFDEAMMDFDRAIALDPKLALAYNDRGTAYGELRKHDEAIADFDRAIELNPKNAEFHFNRGLAYLRMKQDDRALDDFETVLAFDPNHAWANKDLGDILVRRGQYSDARLHYNNAIRWEPNQPSFYRARATAYLAAREYASAIEDANLALAVDPKGVEALGILAFAQFLSGNFDAAKFTFEIDLRAGSKSPHAMIYRYLAQLRGKVDAGTDLNAYLGNADLSQWPGPLLGHLQGSIPEEAMLKAAKDTAPQAQCQARFVLGEVSLARDENETAARNFEAAVAICPKSMLDYFGANAELTKLK